MQCKDKRVFITGASKGIGAACAHQFAAQGAALLLCARNLEPLEVLAATLRSDYGVVVKVFSLDVSDTAKVSEVFASLPAEWQAVDVLVNNAGLGLGTDSLQQGQQADWDTMIDVNIKGLLAVTKVVVQQMLQRNQGHVINLGSVAGYQVYPGGAVYCATKFAVRALTDGLKMDVHGTPIRVSLINPGMVETDFSMTRFKGDQARADAVYQGVTALTADDIADAIVYCATRPAHVDVREIHLMPTAQTAVHLCHRDS